MHQLAERSEYNDEQFHSVNIYTCPVCREALLVNESCLNCNRCSARYPLEDGIPVFADKRGYWCNVSREKMREVISAAETSGDWHAAVTRLIPRYAPAVVPLYRADAQFLFPINSDSRVLDAGSMWGGLTVPIAQFAKEVYAVDQTWETLRFLKTRAQQMGLNNIIPVESSIHRLPFPDQFFDFVVLNGVLEWLGMDQDVVLEKHWDNKREDQHDYQRTPRDMQLAALQELRRVIKPGGGIYIAIENRIGLQYFVGHPDDHMNVRFVTFLPRKLANWITRKRRNVDYRTYVYTPAELRELVQEAGLVPQQIYSAYPHYGKISRLVPFTLFSSLGSLAKSGYAHIKVALLSALWKCIPAPADKYFSPSLALVAARQQFNLPPRLIQVLIKAGVIASDQAGRYELALINNRFGNGHTTNYLVYDFEQKKPVFFCKISRDTAAAALNNESAQLSAVTKLLAGTDLEKTIPALLFSGTIDGITLQVSAYFSAQSVSGFVWNALRCLPRFVGRQRMLESLQRYGSKRWLRQISPWMLLGIDWLARFQQISCSERKTSDYVADGWLTRQLTGMARNGIHALTRGEELDKFKLALAQLGTAQVPMVMQHGDYDICNLLNENGTLRVVDFEHAEQHSLPFFDLANLLFSPMITEWKWAGCRESLSEYAKLTGWSTYINEWLDHYAKLSGVNRELLDWLPQFAAVEQNAKQYPAYRDPYDYPMYGQAAFDALMSWNLCRR